MLLLCTLSKEEKIAAVFGGGDDEHNSTQPSKAVVDLANMIVHFLDILTQEDGGTNPELELGLAESTFSMFQRADSMSQDEKKKLVEQIAKSRRFSRIDIGLDVSVVCHQLLALAARWHHTACEKGDPKTLSPLLLALARHDDIDVNRCQRILNRLVMSTPQEVTTSHGAVFFNDGFRPLQDESAADSDLNEETRRRRRSAKQDQMSHDEIDKILGNHDQIVTFLKDLRYLIDQDHSKLAKQAIEPAKIVEIQRSLMLQGGALTEDEYEERLSDWVVSSSPFAGPGGNSTYIHYYDSTARSRVSTGSGKSLVKEARRCHKILPTPHVNSSCFVCFAEERMDLCRAIVTGPVRRKRMSRPFFLYLF
jgi:hypothetical protein